MSRELIEEIKKTDGVVVTDQIKEVMYNPKFTADAKVFYLFLNMIGDNGRKKIKLIEIQEGMGISRHKLKKSIKQLEDNGMIKQEGKSFKLLGGS